MYQTVDAVRPLNELLSALHGPTVDVAATVGRLVPFPEQIRSLPDADLLDLSVHANMVDPRHATSADLTVSVRYATSARPRQVIDFYEAEFVAADAVIATSEPEDDGDGAIEAVFADLNQSAYQVEVTADRGYRGVKLVVSSKNFDHRELFDAFASWHGGQAPITGQCRPSGLEVSTFSRGCRPDTVVLYSTHYACPETSLHERRKMVDERVGELGWTYREPRDGVLFGQDTPFESEIHVVGDDSSSRVTVVGEFRLR